MMEEKNPWGTQEAKLSLCSFLCLFWWSCCLKKQLSPVNLWFDCTPRFPGGCSCLFFPWSSCPLYQRSPKDPFLPSGAGKALRTTKPSWQRWDWSCSMKEEQGLDELMKRRPREEHIACEGQHAGRQKSFAGRSIRSLTWEINARIYKLLNSGL